jgi:hypothetical protein
MILLHRWGRKLSDRPYLSAYRDQNQPQHGSLPATLATFWLFYFDNICVAKVI